MSNGTSKLVALIYLYLDNEISARQLVSQVDELVSKNKLLDMPDECMKPFDDLHENLALCVWDEQTYKMGSGAYINEADMKNSVKSFLSKCKKSFSEHIVNSSD